MDKTMESVLLLCLVSALPGCTTTYTIHVRNNRTQEPIQNAAVTLASVSRHYSFLDLRHYLGECGKQTFAEGKTDAQGQVDLKMPSDLGVWHLCLGKTWILEAPSEEWRPMLTRQEFESNDKKQGELPERPQAMLQIK